MTEKTIGNPAAIFFNYLAKSDVLLGLLFYGLGLGIARMNGATISLEKAFMGGAAAGCLLLAMPFLNRRFASLRGLAQVDPGEKEFNQQTLLQISLGFLAVSGLILIYLIARHELTVSALIVFILILAAVIFNSVPPVRLVKYGMGELTVAIIIGSLVSGFGYFLQADQYQRLLLTLALPLVLLILASELAVSLEQFGKIKGEETRLMVDVIGWQRAILLHDILILGAYILVGLFGVFLQPWRLTWPGLLTIPLGIFEIWQLWRISQGAKPNWKILRLTAGALVYLAVYFMVLTVWTR